MLHYILKNYLVKHLKIKKMDKTSLEWLFNELWNTDKDKFVWNNILNKAKEMENDNLPKAENKDSFGEISDKGIENN